MVKIKTSNTRYGGKAFFLIGSPKKSLQKILNKGIVSYVGESGKKW